MLAQAGTLDLSAVQANTVKQLRTLIEAAQQDAQRKAGSDLQKIGDLYASYMDLGRLEKLGYRPLIGELQRIRVLRDRRGLPPVIAHLSQIGVAMPYTLSVYPDWDDGGKGVAHILPGGLGMPSAHYRNDADGKPGRWRDNYLRHVETVLALGGARAPQASAQAVLDLETKLAHLQAMRAPHDGAPAVQALAIDKLGTLAPGYDWANALGLRCCACQRDVGRPGRQAVRGPPFSRRAPAPMGATGRRTARCLSAPIRHGSGE